MTPRMPGCRRITWASSTVSGALWRQGQLLAEPLHELMATGQRVTKNVVGPAAARLADTPELMPCTVADIPVTTKTPTAMPRIVNAARTLLVRMESKAIATPSDNIFNRSRIVTASLGAKRDDRIELRGAAGRIDACRDANAAA